MVEKFNLGFFYFLIPFFSSCFELKAQHMQKINFIALGDSYTIGEGAKESEAWPSLLVKNLQEEGWKIELIANPSITGWTTKDLIEKELPVFDRLDCNFASILIGVNDWVQEISEVDFSSNLDFILDHLQNGMKDPSKILIINIPDFGVTPEGAKFSGGRNISAGIKSFNLILKKKAEQRSLTYVDIFPISQNMKYEDDLIAKDGLHPSAKEYALWEPIIRQAVLSLLQ
jgi:lysophospholipase L1-like esterase